MGAIAGVLSGIGGEMQRENIANEKARQTANEEMAIQLEEASKNALNPELAANLRSAAFKYRTLKAGQKPGKDLDLHNILYQHVKQNDLQAPPGQTQQGQAQPAQPGQAPASPQGQPAPGTPAQASMPTPPAGVDLGAAESQGPGQDQGQPSQPQALSAPPGQAPAPTPMPVQMQQVIAAAPPPVSGMSSPGFGADASSFQLPVPTGRFTDSNGQQMQSATPLPNEIAQMAINRQRLLDEATHQAAMRAKIGETAYSRQVEREDIDRRIAALKTNGSWDALTPRQKAEIQIGAKQITPEPHFNIAGREPTPEGALDHEGKQITTPYVRRVSMNGEMVMIPDEGGTRVSNVNDPKSPLGAYRIVYDTMGKEISRTPIQPSAAYLPTTETRSNTNTTIKDIGGAPTPVTTTNTSKTTRQKGAGANGSGAVLSPPPGTTATPASPRPVASSGGSVRVGTPIGPAKNVYTPAGQTALAETEPILNKVNQAMALLEKVKDSNMPLTYAISRLGYSAGMANDATTLINNLEMGKILGAARVLKGSSRSRVALEKAMLHLPDPKIDSPKLMYEKLDGIRGNLNDIKASVEKYERKYSTGGEMTAPPNTGPATHRYNPTTGRIETIQ